jgi:peptidoglycan/xylan/chitin deacetylase (PgdA/CDA1 family)
MRAHLFIDVPAMAAGISLAPAFGLLPVAAIGVGVSLLHTWAVIDRRCWLYMPVMHRLPAGRTGVALTFDDGPHPEVTPRVLDLLAAAGATATFFVIGHHVRAHGPLLRRMIAEGHGLGLHSDTHARTFPCWTPGRVVRDLQANAAAIADATGAAPPTLFRPPMGLKNPFIGEAVRRLGLTTVTWTATARDGGRTTAERATARLLPAVRPRSILVLHDGHEPTRPADRTTCLAVLDRLLPELATRGLAGERI